MRVAGTLAGIIAVGAGLVAALWFIVAITILPTPAIDGDRYVVRWATWPQGQAPIGAVAAVGTEPVRSDLGSRVGYLMNSDAFAVVQVTGGVRDAAAQDPTLTTDHYLITCLSGSCEQFDGRIPVNHVLGEVLGKYSPPATVAPLTVDTPPAPAPSPVPAPGNTAGEGDE